MPDLDLPDRPRSRVVGTGRGPGFGALLAAVLAAVAVGTAACGDDPFTLDWAVSPDTVQLYSLARPELNLASGFSFVDGRPVRVEAPNATGNWDIAVDTEGGHMVLLPPGALGINSRARIAVLEGRSFEGVVEAPSDSAAYVANEPVPVEVGIVYVVRTNLRRGAYGQSCMYYAKMEPLVVDLDAGVLRFQYDSNPYCNERGLVPPNTD